jgi:predicted transcriptional regulator YdeE
LDLGQTYQQIHQCLPRPEYEHAGTPEFEHDGTGLDPADPDSLIRVHIPVK